METVGYDAISKAVRGQLEAVCAAWRARLAGTLLSVYLHGSLALSCFCEGVSDIDLLMVVGGRLSRDMRLSLANDMLALDLRPCPLEMSAVYAGDMTPFAHPTPCQFHYSELWRTRYRALLSGEEKACFLIDEDFRDPDIACHTRLAKESGVTLYGEDAKTALPDVPESAFLDSITADMDNYDFHACAPRYFPSNILILCRVLSYRLAGRILSKRAGAELVRDTLPAVQARIVQSALSAWYAGAPMPDYPPQALEALRHALIRRIQE